MRALFMAIALCSAAPSWAQVPNVVADIAPVHSLVAMVMGDLGQPALLLGKSDDPHDVQMRPSQARALAQSDLVVWMGPALTPWLATTLSTLAQGALSLALLDLANPPLRIEGDVAEFLSSGDGSATSPADPEAHDAYAHGAHDPHAWLDPVTAIHYLMAIADTLSRTDPANAQIYARNANAAIDRLTALNSTIRTQLAPVRQTRLIAYHDAYRYFLLRYDLTQAGYVSDSAGNAPGVASLGALRADMDKESGICILIAPGTQANLIDALNLDPTAKLVEIDALGVTLDPGPALYETMIQTIADTLATCAAP